MDNGLAINIPNGDANNNAGNKKQFKFAKMRFTELKNKFDFKKININAEKTDEKTDAKENEKMKKQMKEKEISQIENELDNKKLLLKVLDSETVTDHLDDFFSKDRLKNHPEAHNKHEDNYFGYSIDENKKDNYETLDEFWKKYRNFNDITRKGMIKNMTPSFGFIKSCQDNCLIPNPIGLPNKYGEHDTVSLKYLIVYMFFVFVCNKRNLINFLLKFVYNKCLIFQ